MEKLFVVLVWLVAISSGRGKVITAQSFPTLTMDLGMKKVCSNKDATGSDFPAARYQQVDKVYDYDGPCRSLEEYDKCFTDRNISAPNTTHEPFGEMRLLFGDLELACSRFDDYRSALDCAHNFTWWCTEEETRDYLARPGYFSSVMHRLCDNKQDLNGHCVLSVSPKYLQCIQGKLPHDPDLIDFCYYRQLATECVAEEMTICGCITTRVMVEIYAEDSRPPLCNPPSVVVPTCSPAVDEELTSVGVSSPAVDEELTSVATVPGSSADTLSSHRLRGVVLTVVALLQRRFSASPNV